MPPLVPRISDMSSYTPDDVQPVGQFTMVNFVFDKCPLSLAVKQICSVNHVSISFPSDVADAPVYGHFKNVSLDTAITALAGSAGLVCHGVGAECFVLLHDSDGKPDNVTLYVDAPFFDMTAYQSTEFVTVQMLGSCLVVSGPREYVKDYVRSVQAINKRLTRSYACELSVLRTTSKTYLDVAADLKFKASSILDVSDITDILEIFANADATFNRSKQVSISMLYLSEGQESSLDIGSVRQREMRTISSEGYTSTSGYKEFRDGLQVKLKVSALSNDLFVLTSNISQSKFRDTSDSADVVPINDTSEINSARVIVYNGAVSLLASLSDTSYNTGSRLLGVQRGDGYDLILFFVVVKRVNPSDFGSVLSRIDIDTL